METRYNTWEWNYGQSPAFTMEKKGRYEGGGLNIKLNVEDGLIKQIKIFGDFLGVGDINDLEKQLIDTRFDRDTIKRKLDSIELDHYLLKITSADLLNCLFS